MAHSRLTSRLDRSKALADEHTQRPSCVSRAHRAFVGANGERPQLDPGRLIEDAFSDRHPADAPETYVIAWLALIAPSTDAPRAASLLVARLIEASGGGLSLWQARLIELLAFVSQHRCPSADGQGLADSTVKEGLPS